MSGAILVVFVITSSARVAYLPAQPFWDVKVHLPSDVSELPFVFECRDLVAAVYRNPTEVHRLDADAKNVRKAYRILHDIEAPDVLYCCTEHQVGGKKRKARGEHIGTLEYVCDTKTMGALFLWGMSRQFGRTHENRDHCARCAKSFLHHVLSHPRADGLVLQFNGIFAHPGAIIEPGGVVMYNVGLQKGFADLSVYWHSLPPHDRSRHRLAAPALVN